jgi:hypothetical protein
MAQFCMILRLQEDIVVINVMKLLFTAQAEVSRYQEMASLTDRKEGRADRQDGKCCTFSVGKFICSNSENQILY